MANEYLVNSADLISVADAIRDKSETTEQLVFPDDFVTAIRAITGGSAGVEIIDFDLTAWTKKNPYPSRTYTQGTYDLSNKTLKGYVTGSYQHVVMVKNEKIDFSSADTLNFIYDLDKDLTYGGGIIVKISTSNSDPNDSTCVVVNQQIDVAGTDVDVSIDVSSVDGSYYLWIGLATWGDLGTVNFEVSNLYLN